ncbi:MAG TPA: nuclear transport factor 2 family protein [Pyrinomonadaceae bacterium]
MSYRSQRLAALLFAVSMAATDANSAEQELRSLVTQIGTAWAHSDVAVLERLTAPDFIHSNIYGKVQRRSEWLKYAGQPRALEIEFEDLEIRVIGNVAVVTGGTTFWDPKEGKEKATHMRLTQVWQHNKPGWQRIVFQATLITK